IADIEDALRRELAPAAALPNVADVRVLGTIGVVEVDRPVDVGRFQKECVRRGVWIRPFGRNVYVMPPYIIEPDDLAYLCRQLVEIVSDEANY
ncbi:MAG: aminotransferase class III-fold pyridoxal phosphate-dependent enzyme, partial [Muribaculaceae bacterium]|nr:aminotransferase class III-fold pyridoxal phosphate-dependent enzyme [Muribaculaceae bacterium]